MEKAISLLLGDLSLEGILALPPGACGLVIFAHGSGSGLLSPRNRYVASVLQEAGLATLLFDLLTSREEAIDSVTGELRFNIDFLAGRLISVTDLILKNKDTCRLNIGYFGASTGAAAALVAAAERVAAVKAVVSRGGRPDLAGDSLMRVQAPVLLIVGGLDNEVIGLNRQAIAKLVSTKELSIVPGATHLFEEKGTLPQAARLAAEWFVKYLKC